MKARVAGAELAYDVRGRGDTVLLLHAFPLGMAMWDAQAEALASRFQVVRFDARGFGGSPPGEGPLTMERIADDAAALLDHLGLSRAAVCGLSMGGYAAFAFVRRHGYARGEGCGVVVLLCCGFFGFGTWWMVRTAQKALTEDPAEIRRLTAEIVSIDVPESLPPRAGMDLTVPVLGTRFMTWVAYAQDDENDKDGLFLVQFNQELG